MYGHFILPDDNVLSVKIVNNKTDGLFFLHKKGDWTVTQLYKTVYTVKTLYSRILYLTTFFFLLLFFNFLVGSFLRYARLLKAFKHSHPSQKNPMKSEAVIQMAVGSPRVLPRLDRQRQSLPAVPVVYYSVWATLQLHVVKSRVCSSHFHYNNSPRSYQHVFHTGLKSHLRSTSGCPIELRLCFCAAVKPVKTKTPFYHKAMKYSTTLLTWTP